MDKIASNTNIRRIAAIVLKMQFRESKYKQKKPSFRLICVGKQTAYTLFAMKMRMKICDKNGMSYPNACMRFHFNSLTYFN